MKIHEYQARDLLAKFGIPIPAGVVASSPDEAAAAFKKLGHENGAKLAVVKAQVHAGGRGKGGGVKLVRSADEAGAVTATMLGTQCVAFFPRTFFSFRQP